MQRKGIIALLALLMTLSLMSRANESTDTLRVLWVGNSYTYVNDLPQTVEDLMAEQGTPIRVTRFLKGGERFKGHLANPALREAIQQGDWDYVVLQGHSTRPAGPTDGVAREVYPYAFSLDSLVHAYSPEAKVLFYMTWGHRYGTVYKDMWPGYTVIDTYDGMQMRLITSYMEMALRSKADYAPVGLAWQKVMHDKPSINLYQDDNYHPSKAGSWLAANVFTATLLSRSFTTAIDPGIPSEEAEYLHEVAVRTVMDKMYKKEWKLVWEDDFNKGVLDTTIWSRTTRGTSDWDNTQSDDERCLTFRDGCLVLRGIVNDNPNDPAEFLTGGVWTRDKKAIQPGRIEIRARVGKAQGAWPALWAMPFDRSVPWPNGGEVDIMERLNGDSIAYQTVHSYYTYVVNKNSGNPPHGGSGAIDPDGFNVYGVDIETDSIVFHINGIQTFTYRRDPALDDEGGFPYFCPQYLLMDMQLGGKWVGKVNPEDLPVEMEIDWVRSWVRR